MNLNRIDEIVNERRVISKILRAIVSVYLKIYLIN